MANPGGAQNSGGRSAGRGARLAALGGVESREYLIAGRTTAIGSAADNDIVLAETTVSRRHAVIRRRLDRYVLADLESTNGTYVNGKRVASPVTIRRGDEIRFGAIRFAFFAPRQRAIFAALGRIRLSVAIPAVVLIFLGAFALTRRLVDDGAPGDSTSAPVSAIATPVAEPSDSAANPRASSGLSPIAAGVATPPPRPTPVGPQPKWLRRLNDYRTMAGLSEVPENPALSRGDKAHVEYLFENYSAMLRRGENPGIGAHIEQPGNPGYTPEGAAAGKSSDVDFVTFGGIKNPDPDGWSIVDWISGAFHRLSLLNPRLRTVGYYERCDSGLCVSALDSQSDVERASPGGGAFATPVAFPPSGASVTLRSFTAEWPNPLSSCDGYVAPTGLPITLSMGTAVVAKLESFRVERIDASVGASVIEACGFDAATYSNPDATTQRDGHDVLYSAGTVVVIPRHELAKGTSYRVAVTVNGKQYSWSFSTAP